MATNLPSCFSIQFLEQLMKFLVNFTLLKYVKSQRSYGFLITKKLIFGCQILDFKDHFSVSLNPIKIIDFPCILLMQIYPFYNSKIWFSVILNDSPSIKPSVIDLLLRSVNFSFDLKVLCISLHNLDDNVHSRNKCVNVSSSLEQKQHNRLSFNLILRSCLFI